ncbi:MAG: pyruvate kinase [Anaerolineae bacterium]|nr:pyruvate kinase [Anaerolineae bacterium]
MILENKRTKIVCTIGPASCDEATLRAMIRAGMNVARINFSHGAYEDHAHNIANIRRIAQEEGAVVAVMADLQGPKLRTGEIEPGPITLRVGDTVTLTTRPATGANNVVNLPHPDLIESVGAGDTLLLDDAALEFVVEKQRPGELVCKVIVGGELSSHKGVSAPGSTMRMSAITEKDQKDAIFALEQGVDFLALSFVRSANDIQELRWLIRHMAGADADVDIVAKIEKREAISNFDDILDVVDAVMVARGDLGVELSVQEVPLYQKEIIRKCNLAAKPVITATQMLQSMIENPRPTRAEASDVANAILDGTDAVMLSGETAVGKYPVPAVEMMAKIAQIVEAKMPGQIDKVNFGTVKHRHPVTDAISVATCEIAEDLDARLIVSFSWSGYTARQVAKERPRKPIVALSPHDVTCRRLALSWGVLPVLVGQYKSTDEMLENMEHTVLELGLADPGDVVVVTGGIPLGGGGRTNFIKVHALSEA